MKSPMLTDTFTGFFVKQLPDEVLSHPGMIAMQERRMLFGLAKDCFEGRGVIVDAGIFLGASTVAFAQGLKRNKRISLETIAAPPIVSYDRAIAGPNFLRHVEELDFPLPQVGESFEEQLREQIAPIAGLVTLHIGDILGNTGEDLKNIEICFLDILKTPEVARHALRIFLPKVLVGGYIIQQDYFFHELDYIKVYNEALFDKLSYLGEVRSSAVFRVMEPITADDLDRAFAAYDSPEQSLMLHRLAEARTISPARQYLMRLSRAHLYANYRDFRAAEQTVKEADRDFAQVALDEHGHYRSEIGWRMQGLANKMRLGAEEERSLASVKE